MCFKLCFQVHFSFLPSVSSSSFSTQVGADGRRRDDNNKYSTILPWEKMAKKNYKEDNLTEDYISNSGEHSKFSETSLFHGNQYAAVDTIKNYRDKLEKDIDADIKSENKIKRDVTTPINKYSALFDRSMEVENISNSKLTGSKNSIDLTTTVSIGTNKVHTSSTENVKETETTSASVSAPDQWCRVGINLMKSLSNADRAYSHTTCFICYAFVPEHRKKKKLQHNSRYLYRYDVSSQYKYILTEMAATIIGIDPEVAVRIVIIITTGMAATTIGIDPEVAVRIVIIITTGMESSRVPLNFLITTWQYEFAVDHIYNSGHC